MLPPQEICLEIPIEIIGAKTDFRASPAPPAAPKVTKRKVRTQSLQLAKDKSRRMQRAQRSPANVRVLDHLMEQISLGGRTGHTPIHLFNVCLGGQGRRNAIVKELQEGRGGRGGKELELEQIMAYGAQTACPGNVCATVVWT